jgi:hypothetical protein
MMMTCAKAKEIDDGNGKAESGLPDKNFKKNHPSSTICIISLTLPFDKPCSYPGNCWELFKIYRTFTTCCIEKPWPKKGRIID